jgi:hypothetical protein
MKINKITIKGFDQSPLEHERPTEGILEKKGSFLIGQSSRGDTKSISVELRDDDIIELIFEDGTTWLTNPYNLEDLFPSLSSPLARSTENTFDIPFAINIESAERGVFSKVLLKVMNVLAIKPYVEHKIEVLARKLEDKQLDGRIGLFCLGSDFHLYDVKPAEENKPYCLLIHGTASSIAGSFGGLKESLLIKFLEENYGNRILAFQHRTLTENPLQNVRDLVKALPDNCTLHLITTSRGGLVGEVLSRFCNHSGGMNGFNTTELSILKKEYPQEYFESLLGLIDAINKILKKKKITIEKFIRIACPAGGTTLASKRMDNFLNFTFNLIGVGTGLLSNPVYTAFKDLIATVVSCKKKVEILPGLEVQSPDSPFIKALNSFVDIDDPFGSTIINNSLVVIAGNSRAEFKLSALLVIASKLFFRQQNDLVVDTESMSMGTRRSGKVLQFFCDEPGINHFKYFENRVTSNAITVALKSDWGQKLPGFSEEQLCVSVASDRNALLKLDKGQVFSDTAKGARPIVLLLPGIMGSNLSADNANLWINYWKFITGGLKELKGKNVKATSLVSTSYKSLVEYLQNTYDVVTFPFDWRLSLEEAAKKLNAKIIELMKLKQPIKIIGHSMGGVLVRDFIVLHPGTWEKLNKSNGFRLIFLGSPLKGSFRIPAVLFGLDGIIDKLSKIDLVHTKKELVEIFAGFQGILGLLPFNEEENNDFTKLETWISMRRGIEDKDWPLPDKKDLLWFANYRNKVRKDLNDEDYSNAVYIAGKDKATVCGYRIDKKGHDKELVLLSTAEGDQSVTWQEGIPSKMIAAKSVYYVDVTHGSLANDPDMFSGIKEILVSGSTNLFSKERPAVRGEELIFRSPAYRDFNLSLAGVENTLLGLGHKIKLKVSEPPVRASISHGDLRYANYPILAGHFENDGILFAEKAIDKYLNNTLIQRHQIGSYPGPIGTSELFLTENANYEGAIIIGLGKLENLTASELTKTVEQGIAKYLLHVSKCSRVRPSGSGIDSCGISSLLIGSGYGGLAIENSIKAILQGIQNANAKIRNLKLENTRAIEQIEFVELYEDKAVSSLYSLSKIEKQESKSFKVMIEGKRINTLLGAKKRIPREKEEEWWNRITVRVIKDKEDDKIIR